MKYRSTSRFPEQISVIGLGCWELSGSNVWQGSNDEDSIKVVHKALKAGINFFDVAPVYGFGHAEEILGRAIEGFPRDKILIATKCGLVWDEHKRIKRCLKPESVFQEIDQSLKRLKTDYVDLYQLHWPDPNTPIEETLDALTKLQKEGKIRYIGLSNFSRDIASKVLPYISSMQGLYNMFERNATSYHSIPLEYRSEKEILPFCERNGLAFFPYSPLMQGILTGKFLENEVFESPVPEQQGHLIFLVTILYPGKVNEEFFMTKGHYHTVENTAEVYLGIKGKGLILCQTKSGDFEVAEISENRVVYIPPFWAHRAVNIFDEPLIFFGIYPAHAGHDYETIAQSGFVKRVFSKNGRVVIE